MKRPLDGDITKLRVNRTLHGRSVYRNKDVPGHNVFMGYSGRDGDAIDLFTLAGMPVYAMENSTVIQIATEGAKARLRLAGHYTIMYAHIHVKDGYTVGSYIKEGEVIGYVSDLLSDPHLHLEVSQNGKSLSAPTARQLSKKISALYI
jgi:murein DD-endopeptidase MepM/ murein hydrolase activator NlpD